MYAQAQFSATVMTVLWQLPQVTCTESGANMIVSTITVAGRKILAGCNPVQ